MKLLQMGKDMKIQHSISSPPRDYRGTFFAKKVLHGGTKVLGQIYGGIFYMGTNYQIMQGRTLMKLFFFSLILNLVIYIFEKLTPQIGD